MTVIAMTREIGSRGLEVAAGVAARLGLKIIRSEIVAGSVAERLGIEPSAFLRSWRARRRSLSAGGSTAAGSFATQPRRFCASRSKATF